MPVLGPPAANPGLVNQNVAGIVPPLPAGTPTLKNFADSDAAYEYSYSTGTGPYELAGAYGSFFPFSDAYQDGDTVYYRVTDGSSLTEFAIGTLNAVANTISRDTIIHSSNGGAAISWTGRTRLLIHAMVPTLLLCDTPPMVGQVLVWDGTEWCPATLGGSDAPVAVVCPTPPMDGQVLIWSAAEKAYCPADFCTLVAACMAPPCLPFIVYSNRLAVPGYAGDLYTIERTSDSTSMTFAPAGGDAPSAAINTFIGAGHGLVTTWYDQSGSGLDAVSDLAQWDPPAWLDSQVNGHPALQFTRYAGGLFNTTERALKAVGVTFTTAKWTVFVVLKHDDYTTASTYPNINETDGLVGINGNPGDGGPEWGVTTTVEPSTSTPIGVEFTNDAADSTFTNSNGIASAGAAGGGMDGGNNVGDNYTILEFVWSNNPGDAVGKYNGIDFDGLEPTFNQIGGADFTVTGDMGVGDDTGVSGPHVNYAGFITEIWIYNCVLSSADRAARRSDIASYYDITI